ncbi:ECF transporter S component [Enterococcus dongliensis]|uniref:ECF transporter S component n=1 Tax=Enterococcus dongliensis TaxID=2559925 RepID=A0AAP5U1K3_9ENTE|nr:ECF transporter S component [Enterococcus dongliensis]MDT2597536.1 ECF transporter S component [Enterococcus dongliensis]MDT2604731.1 ECF transporter S component [Enterococcus dongliensis]MDT2635355.1 ECF transporter S component [Enterococcus dongliensis]MDT2638259.1 ECF transporter S component [Enterococcus dongliensis]MDT2643319.1 ECF transporter S component [Enterococcus dongliensis]
MKRGIKYDFGLQALMLIPVGVSLNVVGYQLCTILKLPVFIDQIGTYLVALVAGPWVGLITGFLGSLVNGMLNPVAIPYSLVSMSIGLFAGYFSKFKFFKNIIGIVVACAVLTVISAGSAAIVTVFMFGGITGAGTDLVTATFLAAGRQLWDSVFSTNIITGSINTVLNFAISYLVVKRIPPRFLIKLNYGAPYIDKEVREDA